MAGKQHPRKNVHGNPISYIPVTDIGKGKFAIKLERGVKEEGHLWCATIEKLPGYLGMHPGISGALEILLNQILDHEEIFDSSRLRNVRPTPGNIRQYIESGARVHQAIENLPDPLTARYDDIREEAEQARISHTELNEAIDRRRRWLEKLGPESFSSDPKVNESVKAALLQHWLNNPQTARFYLARDKFPRT